jgi:hypothetical protein
MRSFLEHLARAGVGQDDVEHLAVELALFDDLERRDAQALLVDLRAPPARAHVHAADVEVVDHEAGERDQLAFVEEGMEGEVVVGVRGSERAVACVRIVGDDHVARLHASSGK